MAIDQGSPSPDAEWWTDADVARYLGIAKATVLTYRARRQMPEADGKIRDSWVWRPQRIIEWRPAVVIDQGQDSPSSDAEWWTTTDVAAYLQVTKGTVSTYRAREQMPEPDNKIGNSWVWRPQRIIEWHTRRPRKSPRGGRRPAES